MDILLVEDEAQLADVIARNLRARGHTVRTAHTAADAVAALSVQQPAVLILDINLPDITGWEVLRRLSFADRQRLKVVVVSAGPISPKRIEELRPDRHLEKPFPIDALVRILSELAPDGHAPAGGDRPNDG